jgi:thiopeptide-type bacteriocin biosynthesis protein
MAYKSDFSIVRSPLYPFTNSRSIDFTEIIQSKFFNEAIYLSSPNLSDEIEKYLSGVSEAKDKLKLEISLYRYYLRSTYRCTPFGLFAGISVGSISNQTNIQLSPIEQYKKNTRLDTHFLSSFVQQILNDEVVRNELKWYSNNSTYELNEKLRFIEFRIDKETRSHHLTNVDNSEFVQLILSQAKRSATIAELANSLVNDEISFEDARGFVNEMIASCLLISELEPMVTGKEYHVQLLEKLENIPSCKVYFQRLQGVVTLLKETDQKGVGVSTEYYGKIVDELKKWQIDFDPGRLFQCDLLKPTEKCQISTQLTDELGKTISLLEKIAPMPNHSNLKKFIEEFEKRHESQEIPLLSILDADTGIGYPANEQAYADNAPLLTNLHAGNEGQNTNSYNSTKWQKFILQKYQQAAYKSEAEIELTEHELKMLWKDDSSESSTPNSIYSLCSVLASSGEEVDKGNFLIHHEITAGPSAANLLGRFCYMDDELSHLTHDLLREEERAKPDCIFAEILHIPQARLANISMRPVLRNYEIPILTPPSVDEDHTIQLHDLMVSIKNGRIFLRSKKLNKEVIPRLTTAHNFSLNPVPHYHFLCDLQYQGLKANLSWNWGFLNEFAYLPRVRYGKTILAKARWRISLSDLSSKKDVKESELEKLIKPYFASNKIPNRVTISQGDNQLLIDIENHYCVQILAKDLKKFETLELHECLFNESNLFVRGPEGGYTNEIIIPWTKRVEKNNESQFQPQHTTQHTNGTEVQRSFLSGDQWCYVKIYCGVKTADRILSEVLKPITEKLLAEQKIDKWFFIRYADPDHHIRIRFLGADNFYTKVIERLNKAFTPYLENHLIWKVQTDTYNRELERYGAVNMDNSESLFFYDSTSTIQILSLLEGDEGDDLRWQFAIKGVNDLMESFGYNLTAKIELMDVLSSNFKKEFNVESTESKKQLGAKFRELRPKIELALQSEIDSTHEFYEVWQLFEIRKSSLIDCAKRIDELYSSHALEVQKSDLVASYIHMFLNRFCRSKQRMQEMVIYDLLHQHYKSQLARTAKSTSLVSE